MMRKRDVDNGPMNVHQVSVALGIHQQSVKRIPASDLPFFRVNNRGDRRYLREDLDSYIDMRMVDR